MDQDAENRLVAKLNLLSAEQLTEVMGFVDFLANKARKRDALDRLLAPASPLKPGRGTPRMKRKPKPRQEPR
jgi:hypothetical protein